MIRRSRVVEYLPGIELRICSAEDLIVLSRSPIALKTGKM